MCGNEACAEGAILAGCDFYAGYPITPQNELTECMSKRMPEEGRIFIQSESEIAAINMVFGASVTGARAMTSSSSPGISLKQEGISYLAGCELPGVIVNVMRGGPGLGNIAPAQSDYFQATKGGGHGDYRNIVIAPHTVQEMMDFMKLAFDLADEYRNPVMVLTDGILGQMMEPVRFPSGRGTSKKANKPWALTGCKGRKSRFIRSLLLKDGELEALNDKLQQKYADIEKKEIRYEEINTKDADVVLIGYGSIARTLKAIMYKGRSEGKKIGLLRPITLWPFPYKQIEQLAEKVGHLFVVEMSAGQMVEDVRLAACGKANVRFYGRTGGGVPTQEEIESILYEGNI
ncbi:MAG: 3-methyl-2-oxobutanoate dehydrogenase subunit VorB [Candidatus Omnitrophota bacterium]